MQITFAEAEFTGKKKQTRRDRLLADPESLVPWAVPESVIEPYYPKTDGKQGRPAMGLSRMLRMYILQQVMGFPMKARRMRSMTARRFSFSWASTLGVMPCRMQPPYCAFVGCWKLMV